MTDKQKATQFKTGNEGGRKRRSYRPRRQGLSAAYRRLLTEKDPQTGRSYAEIVARSMLDAALAGDLSAVFEMMDTGARRSVEAAMEKLVAETGCSPLAAKMALSLFSGEAILHGEDVLTEKAA